MKQPYTGQKIREVRLEKNMTQEELSSISNLDIRTIQRIESGEVEPRFSTIKLLADALEINTDIFNNSDRDSRKGDRELLFISFFSGIIFFINWFLHLPFLRDNIDIITDTFHLVSQLIYIISGILFYYGFFITGKEYDQKLLQITSVIIMVLLILYSLGNIISISSNAEASMYVKQIIVALMGLNGIAFGFGLINLKSPPVNLNKLTGILQIIISPFILIPLPIVQVIGLYLSIPYYMLLIFILYNNYRNNQSFAYPTY